MKQTNKVKLGFDVNPDFKKQFISQAKKRNMTNIEYLYYLASTDAAYISATNFNSIPNQIRQNITTCAVNIDFVINDIKCGNYTDVKNKLMEANELLWKLIK